MKQWLLISITAVLMSACAVSNFNKQDHAFSVQQPELAPQQFNHPDVIALRTKYRSWLTNALVEPNRIEVLLDAASPSLNHIVELADGAAVEMDFPDWFVAGGKIPDDKVAASNLELESIPSGTMPANFERPSKHSSIYLGHVYFTNRCDASKPIGNQADLSIEEFRHFHQFLLHEAIWTEHDFEIAEAAVAQITAECPTRS